MNRKNIFLISLLMLILSPLIAVDFTATGYGSSINEAREDAQNSLVSQISTEVSVMISTSVYDDSKETHSDEFNQVSLHNSGLTLMGTVYEKPQIRDDGLYEITIVLPASSAPLYYDRLSSLFAEIDDLYAGLERLEDIDSVSYAGFDQLTDLLTEYESCRVVATSLDRSRAGELEELPVSKSQVEALRNAKVFAEESRLQERIDSFDLSETYGLLTEENEEERAKLEEQLAMLRSENEERMRKIHEETLLKLRGIGYGELSDPDVAEDGSYADISRSLDAIDRQIQGVGILKQAIVSSMSEICSEYQEACDEYRRTEMSKPYSEIDLDDAGKPTREAVYIRSAGVSQEIAMDIQPLYTEEASSRFTEYMDRIVMSLDTIADMADGIIGQRFRITSLQPELSVAVTGFKDDSFIGYALLSHGEDEMQIDFSIPYTAWMGEAIPDYRTNRVEYEDYRFIASQWLNILKDNPAMILVELDMRINYDPVEHIMFLYADSYSITRLDTEDVVVSDVKAGVSRQVAVLPFSRGDLSLSYGNATDFMDSIGPQEITDSIISEHDLDDKLLESGLVRLRPSAAQRRLSPERRSLVDASIVEDEESRAHMEGKPIFKDAVMLMDIYAWGGFRPSESDGSSGGFGGLGLEFLFPFAVSDTPDFSGINIWYSSKFDLSYIGLKSSTVSGNHLLTTSTGLIGLRMMLGATLYIPMADYFSMLVGVGFGAGYSGGDDVELSFECKAGALLPVGASRIEISLVYAFDVGILSDSGFSSSVGIIAGYMFSL